MEIQLTQGPFDALVTQKDFVLLIATFGGMLSVMVLEQLWPRRSGDAEPQVRWVANWAIAAFNFFASVYIALYIGQWLGRHYPSPLLSLFDSLPVSVGLFLVFVLLEFLAYWLHRLFHRIPALWRLHAVHHSDSVMDVTTSHRHHLGEVLFNSLALLPFMLVMGIPVGYLVAATLLRLPLVLFAHSNLNVPVGLDHTLRWFIVTPDYHRVHHATDYELSNSNFATVLPVFDRIFGTMRTIPADEQLRLAVGADKPPSLFGKII